MKIIFFDEELENLACNKRANKRRSSSTKNLKPTACN